MEIQFELMYNRIVDMIELVIAVVDIDLIVKVTPIVKVELIGKAELKQSRLCTRSTAKHGKARSGELRAKH